MLESELGILLNSCEGMGTYRRGLLAGSMLQPLKNLGCNLARASGMLLEGLESPLLACKLYARRVVRQASLSE